MFKAWPFSFFLGTFSLIYGGSSLISETPFFVGTDSRKLKEIEWVYIKLGPELTGAIFLVLGMFLLYLSIKDYKTQREDFSGLTAILVAKFTFALIVIVYLLMAAIVRV